MKKDLIITYIITAYGAEARECAEAVALEQSIELPREAVKDPRVSAQIIPDILDLTPVRRLPDGLVQFRLRLAYSTILAGEDIPQFINLLFGNISLKGGILIEDIELPQEILSLFPGPAHGIEGIRDVCKCPSGALLCSVLKPAGSTTQSLAEMAGKFAKAGVHFIKDDHNLADQSTSPFEKRVKAVQKTIKTIDSWSIYIPNITGPIEGIEEKIAIAFSEGIKGFLVSPFLIGLDTFRYLREKYPVIWMAHPSFSGAFFNDRKHGFRAGLLLGKILRLLGADMVIYPDSAGRFPFTITDCREIANGLREGYRGRFKPAMPVPAGGINVPEIKKIYNFYGNDVMLLIGGSVYLDKDGLELATRKVLDLLTELSRERFFVPESLSNKTPAPDSELSEGPHKPYPEGVINQTGEWAWDGIEKTPYKPEGHNFVLATKSVLYIPSAGEAGFDVRYFEIEPGGHSSFERHRHVHFVIGARGEGELRLDNNWHIIRPNSIVLIPPNCPHQLRNKTDRAFGFYCIVDHVRDEPVELEG